MNGIIIAEKLWEQINKKLESEADRNAYLAKIVVIQRRWRAVLAKRFVMGKALLAHKNKRLSLFRKVMKDGDRSRIM